jgi:hypothetical protein
MRKPRNPKLAVVAALVSIAVVAACSSSPEPPTEAEIARAQAALVPLKQGLKSALMEAMPEGPDVAIAVCREQAPDIAAAASVEGVKVGRTSHRLRNPANAPAPWMNRLLASYVTDPGKTEGTAVRLPDGGVGWVEPIRAQGLCLTCHGSDIAEPIAEKLAELYPDDDATGFAEGDFRGLFWATVPPEA